MYRAINCHMDGDESVHVAYVYRNEPKAYCLKIGPTLDSFEVFGDAADMHKIADAIKRDVPLPQTTGGPDQTPTDD